MQKFKLLKVLMLPFIFEKSTTKKSYRKTNICSHNLNEAFVYLLHLNLHDNSMLHDSVCPHLVLNAAKNMQ
jgi:dihydroorotase